MAQAHTFELSNPSQLRSTFWLSAASASLLMRPSGKDMFVCVRERERGEERERGRGRERGEDGCRDEME